MPTARPADHHHHHRRQSVSLSLSSHTHNIYIYILRPFLHYSLARALSFFTHPIIGSTPHPSRVYKRSCTYICVRVLVRKIVAAATFQLLLFVFRFYNVPFFFSSSSSVSSSFLTLCSSGMIYVHIRTYNLTRQIRKRRWEKKPCQSKTSVSTNPRNSRGFRLTTTLRVQLRTHYIMYVLCTFLQRFYSFNSTHFYLKRFFFVR